jgi:hypothetical protein
VSREKNSLNFRKNRKLGSIWGIRAVLGVERQSEIGPLGGEHSHIQSVWVTAIEPGFPPSPSGGKSVGTTRPNATSQGLHCKEGRNVLV